LFKLATLPFIRKILFSYFFIAEVVTYLFSRYLLIVVLVIYSLLKMAVKNGVSKTQVVGPRPTRPSPNPSPRYTPARPSLALALALGLGLLAQ